MFRSASADQNIRSPPDYTGRTATTVRPFPGQRRRTAPGAASINGSGGHRNVFALRRVSTPLLLGMAAHAASAYAEPVKGDVAAGTVSQGTAPPGVFSLLPDSQEHGRTA